MRANVLLTLRERGKIVDRRKGHNVLVDYGRAWLAHYIGEPTEVRSIRYLGLGIGGVDQVLQGMVTSPPLNPSYRVGFDPNTTNGFQYRDDCPISPPVTTLELPVRLTGGILPYWGAAPTDEWLVDMAPGNPYGAIITHPTLYSTSYRAFFNGGLGHITYGPFTSMPISEAGLYLNDSSPVTALPYSNQLVAYHSFPTIVMTTAHVLEVFWHVRF